MSTEQKKPSPVDAAIADAKTRRQQAQAAHPSVTPQGQPDSFPEDEDDKPVYSIKQVERMVAAGIGPSSPAQAASGGLQTSSFTALIRELDRRKAEAQTKLAGIPTELLELELLRRKDDKPDG